MKRSVVLFLIALLAVAPGCSSKPRHMGTKEKVEKGSFEFVDLDYMLKRNGEGVEVTWVQTVRADVKTIDQYSKQETITGGWLRDTGVVGLVFLPFTIAGDVVTGGRARTSDFEEVQGTERRTIKVGLADGASVNGYLTLRDVRTGSAVLSRVVSLSSRNSKVLFPAPTSHSGCLEVDFNGDVHTLKKDVPVQIREKIGC